MNKQEKLDWIVSYITEHGWQDIMTSEFVNRYIEECEPAKVIDTILDPPKVPELGRYLSELHKKGILDRFTIRLSYHYDGYPKWIYGYRIKE